jgi:transcriptional regulator GlxA family with amidase domain
MTTSIDFLPTCWHSEGVIENVAVLAYDGVSPFELGVLCEAWGTDRSDQGLPLFDFAVCAPEPGRVATAAGFGLAVDHDLGRASEADLVAVPAVPRNKEVPESVVRALQEAYERGARVLSICSGAFALGAAGLLDGRDCTTHWFYTHELAERFPEANVIPEVLYVDADPIITGAGSAAGLDACLHLYRKEFGASVANMVARRMVVPPQRDGGQAQFIRSAVPECDAETLAPLLTWITEHLDEELGVESLARRSAMSSRTFARRFREETGATPHAWVVRQRVLRAEELLESTGRTIDQIASDVGFSNAATLRHHFTRARGLSPQQYRRAFGRSAESEKAG